MTETSIRAFVAIDLPESIHARLTQVVAHFKRANISAVRWTSPANIHLTLKFLGNTSKDQLDQLISQLDISAKNYPTFEIVVHGIGAFPNPKRARIVWAGVRAGNELQQLQKEIENHATAIGCPPEERPFSPHLTIGRVNKNAAITEIAALSSALEQTNFAELGRFTADHFTLFRSDLRPHGPVYTSLAQFVLSK